MYLNRKLEIISVWFVSACVTACLAGIFPKTPERDDLRLIDGGISILKSCHGDRVTPVGLAGDSTGMIATTLWSRDSLPVTLIEPVSGAVAPVSPQSRYKLQVFIVAASSPLTLTKSIQQIKSSIWWNHMAAFLILDRTPLDHDCSNAFELLWAAWEMDILKANVICHHRTRGRLVSSFNPYTSWAPHPWNLVKRYSGKNEHPWTLFVRGYEEGAGICDGLDFDKTKDLGGYELRISTTDASYANGNTTFDAPCGNPFANLFCDILLHALNAKPKVLIRGSINSVGHVDEKGNYDGILGDVATGISDFAATTRILTTMGNLTFAFPHARSQLRALTQYSGFESQLSKLNSVIDSYSRIGLYVVCFITVLFCKFWLGESTTTALLSTLRLICNSSLLKEPDRLAPRIYFGSLLIFVVTLQGIYQGDLASLLTNPKPLPNVNNIHDLAKLGHTIHGSAAYQIHFNGPEFGDRYISEKNEMCTDHVLNNPRAACVAPWYVQLFQSVKYNLHMSRDKLVSLAGALPIRSDWPLEEKVNTLIIRAVERYQVEYLFENITREINQLIELQETEYEDAGPKVMTLEQLGFAFAILGIGLGCATICFIVEVTLGRNRP